MADALCPSRLLGPIAAVDATPGAAADMMPTLIVAVLPWFTLRRPAVASEALRVGLSLTPLQRAAVASTCSTSWMAEGTSYHQG